MIFSIALDMKRQIQRFYIFAALLFLGGNLSAQNMDSLSLGEKSYKVDLIASPNPFDGEVTITFNGGNKKVTAIRIWDIIGKEVSYIDLRNKSGMLSYKLDFSQLPGGVYFCNVYGANGIIETKKLYHTK